MVSSTKINKKKKTDALKAIFNNFGNIDVSSDVERNGQNVTLVAYC